MNAFEFDEHQPDFGDLKSRGIDEVWGLGEGPKNRARPIAEHANRVLAGLRVPAPDPGFERLAALDDLNHAADRFHASINHVIYEVHARAHISGLGTQT